MKIIKGYSHNAIHSHDFQCNPRGFRYLMLYSSNLKEVTCKTCLAKIEFSKTGVYPEKFYKNKRN